MRGYPEPALETVRALLRRMVGRRVAVIGDAMLDTYLVGRVGRVSPEAPVPIVEVQREERMLGGAANVAKCLVALGARVRLCGVVGADLHGDIFLQEARGLKIDAAGVLRDASRPTTHKARVVARNQQMLRLDWEQAAPLDPRLERRLIRAAARAARWAEVVVLSDYAKGALSPDLCRAVLRAAGSRPVVVDPKQEPWARFRGATVLKPNRRDLFRVAGLPAGDDAAAARAARKLAADLGVAHVLLTRSEDGLTLASRGARGRAAVRHLHARQRAIFDPTGAGDTVAGVLALALAAGADIETATWLANVAAGVEVTKFGAATVSDEEILDDLRGRAPGGEHKLWTRAQAARRAAELRRQGKRLVFTNGCFDILHLGHVSYLEKSRALGDALIVGVNSDAGVRRLKGPGRPVQPQDDRMRILAAQACVDGVVLFEEDTPLNLIRALKPHVLCKGADYKRKQDIVGWKDVESWGGRVERIEFVAGRSTTELIGKTRKKR
ncbi:MAG: D-glycero-beta-D-manno-heptose 1-phosphate adenylyltransferase [Planctomycetota bacterium]|nr:D-glycero-beta-D-manno-heptose 1-phosphate adenylyltransferase [Planctomycetota bacterium]